ncbi:hypothetical protein [Spongiactinospora sp. TRM90649]|uniref:hypothetical protein n=1 Tax=Spongiactinospora sp. TRM90649 TaxID=3031114 RepID=UPI0023F73DEC|nr:hypothetical protein [Spongiactinospora sp. TRM90649]MDF5758264.1 hypothetical protein [Spongiactinospora sp. TRM90649]
MTTLTSSPPAAAVPTRPARVWAALFVFEVGRMLRNPALWTAALAVLALRTYLTWGYLTDLEVEPIVTGGTALLISATALILGDLAGTRDRRGGLPETLGAVPGSPAARTLAAALAAGAAGTLVTGLVVGVHLLARTLSATPVAGRLDPFEVLGAMAVTALFGVLGVALGRWIPSLVAGPLALAVLGYLSLFGVSLGFAAWLAPVMAYHSPEWGERPSGAHFAYVVALAVLAGVLALLRHGLRPLPVVAGVAALAVAVPAGAVSVRDSPKAPWTGADGAGRRNSAPGYAYADQVCEKPGLVDVCAFSDYRAWIPEWAGAVEPVAAAVPHGARQAVPVVRQETLSEPYGGDDPRASVRVYMTLSAAGAAQPHRAYLAGITAATIVGLRDGRPGRRWSAEGNGCDARGQARTVVALWLAGRSAPLLPTGPVQVWLGQGTARAFSQLGGSRYGDAEAGYARRLLERPDARERVWANWDRLTRPQTTLREALPLLGLREEFPAGRPEARPCA